MLNLVLSNTRVISSINKLLILLIAGFLSTTIFAKPLSLIKIEIDKNETSLAALKVNNESDLLRYAKELQVQSQVIAKNYFYIAKELREEKAKQEIQQSIKETDSMLIVLMVNIENQDMKNLLKYLSDINLESKDILNAQYSNENSSFVIDYSETMYEGAQSIIEHLEQKISHKNSVRDDLVRQQLLLQRISKFYIAYQAGFNDDAMLGKLADSVKEFEQGINKLRSHNFINEEQEFAFVRLEHYWSISKKFYEGMEKGELTLIVSFSTDHMVSYLNKIAVMETGNSQSAPLLSSSD